MKNQLNVRASSSWTASGIQEFLSEFVAPIRISVQSGGAPLIVPLWFVFENGQFLCASPQQAYLTKLAAEAVTCGFDASVNEIPYRGVRGQGRLVVSNALGEEVLQRLMERYLPDQNSPFANWLSKRQVAESAIIIDPEWITSWDFAGRMT